MKIVVFGLSVSSSWGNGHATLWRGLIKALARRGHRVVFFERDVPWYRDTRDAYEIPGGDLIFYDDWRGVAPRARRELADADAGLVTSFCPDGVAASALLLDSSARLKAFYDLDAPVTLAKLAAGETLSWVGPRGYRDFDLTLSYTGGGTATALQERLGARRVVPLYGGVDPDIHKPTAPQPHYRADLSYLGAYAADRQNTLETLLVEPARRAPTRRFVIGGAQYPHDFPWTENIHFVRHLPPEEHPAFYGSSRLTLNVTREAMARMGWCPSARLFEAAACGTPMLSDWWDGLDRFFAPGQEILIARDTDDVLAALELSDAELARIAEAARERALAEHTADRRAEALAAAFADAAAAPADRRKTAEV